MHITTLLHAYVSLYEVECGARGHMYQAIQWGSADLESGPLVHVILFIKIKKDKLILSQHSYSETLDTYGP